eukprot:15315866-Heterocapsa_arctica.AAC.1
MPEQASPDMAERAMMDLEGDGTVYLRIPVDPRVAVVLLNAVHSGEVRADRHVRRRALEIR